MNFHYDERFLPRRVSECSQYVAAPVRIRREYSSRNVEQVGTSGKHIELLDRQLE
jgi:hypothetical protein